MRNQYKLLAEKYEQMYEDMSDNNGISKYKLENIESVFGANSGVTEAYTFYDLSPDVGGERSNTRICFGLGASSGNVINLTIVYVPRGVKPPVKKVIQRQHAPSSNLQGGMMSIQYTTRMISALLKEFTTLDLAQYERAMATMNNQYKNTGMQGVNQPVS